MLNYQTTSFHDALYVRRVLGLRPAPEFEDWLQRMEIFSVDVKGGHAFKLPTALPAAFQSAMRRLA
jgi:ethanolamine ammonia-lyase large subunit